MTHDNHFFDDRADRSEASAGTHEHEQTTPPSSAPSGTHRRMAVRQSNHDTWALPDCLTALCDARPLLLWEAVAHWALREGRGVSRDDVAQAFHIAPRRAADVMRYILLSQTATVTCASLVVRREDGVRQMLFHVTQVAGRAPARAPSPPRKRPAGSAVARRHEVAALRKAFLRKVVG
ncbi:TPA: CaiF/GrlA family transcriptional regulator [Serratia liquefaciens]